jgi:hypothetical protein
MVKWRPGARGARCAGRAAGPPARDAGRERIDVEVLIAAVSSLMVMVPLWRITRRTGRDPWLSLLFLGTPPFGTLVFVAILAFGRWPNEGRATPAEPGPSGPADPVTGT